MPAGSTSALAAHLAQLGRTPGQAAQAATRVATHLPATASHLRRPGFDQLDVEDLWLLFHGYDQEFFAGTLALALGPRPRERLGLRLSARMTSAGGKAVQFHATHPPRFEIVISSHLLFTNFRPGQPAPVINGLPCPSRLDGLQRIFEHELVHLVELLLTGRSSCRAAPFRALARGLFGHTAVTHRLATTRDRAWQDHGLRGGTRVTFEFEGRRLEGFVNRVTKRATVLVPDAGGTPYSDGHRYQKYYVPVEQLTRR